MNPNTPFSGQPPGVFQTPPGTSAGIFPVQPPFQFSQLPVFGQNSGGLLKNPGFAPHSDFTITSGLQPSGQGLGFGQPPGFTQPFSLGQTTSFVTSLPTSSSIAGKQGFNFNPPTNLGGSQNTSSFGATSGETSGSSFGRPHFSFKPPENALFQPIFGTGSEQEKLPNQITPTPFTFSLPGASGSGSVAPFGISQESSSSSVNTSISFSKPASSNTLVPSFSSPLPSKITEDDKKRPISLFGNPGSFTSFSNSSVGSLGQLNKVSKPEHEELLSSGESLPILRKGKKRKEEQEPSPRRHDYDAVDEPELLARSEHSSVKPPVKLNRPRGGGLFNRTLQDMLKSNKKESKMERVSLESGEIEQTSMAGGTQSGFAMVRSSATKKKEENKTSLEGCPFFLCFNRGSTESLGGLSSSDLTVIQYKNIPDHLNNRNVIENHLKKFIRFQRIRTNVNKKLAIVHCFDHVNLLLKCPSLGYSSPAKKQGLKKSLQFEAYAFDSGSEGHGPEIFEASASSLSSLVGLVAETSEDKYRVLDQRDKIMRQARVKQIDLGKAKTFVGTCPDMCPEKERYMRETRNQLSIFEVIPGTDKVDHAAAIKEYSRSSADQEEPLPHELRPSEVLSMTMDYLVTQIMDKGEGNYREWYDFVWDRTRGIRKDITQQHLCCPVTVSLMEKCTRFHIHCSHHLCEEPMSSFDAKINNENMTKCLQSLKEMYQDLAIKGIYCKSEAEFRGYNVLLNLNKGDILREVQQFRPDVRNSTEVRFAVQAFAALNSNNFVRFFKLVQTASYLNACLLHCYFSQIRRDALRSLNIAYTVSTQRSTIFPLDNVVRMLLFKDFEEATDFISYYGLSVSDGFVELNRSAFLEPESLPKPKKSLFVGQKLTASVGEIVSGGVLPPVIRHIPLCSFNAQNKYTGESAAVDSASSSQKASVEVTDLEVLRAQPPLLLLPLVPAPLPSATGSTFRPISQPSLPPPPPKLQPDIAEVVEDLVHDVLEGECREIGSTGAAYAQTAIWISNVTTDEIMTDVMLGILRQIASDVISAEKLRLEEERRRAEEERQTFFILVVETLRQGDVDWNTLCALEKDQRARVARCSKEVCAEIMGVFLEDEIFQSAKETLQELQCFCKYLQRWREAVAARKKLKRQMRSFPAAPCCVDPKHKLKALSPSAECPIAREHLAKMIVNLGHAGNLGISCLRLRSLQNKAIHQMKVQHFYHQLLRDAVWTPLDLPSLVAENIPVKEKEVFWKALLVLPGYEECPYIWSSVHRIISDWLKAKLMIGKNLKEDMSVVKGGIQTLALHTSLHMKNDWAACISVCVKVTEGTLSPSELNDPETQKELLGTRGLVLLLSPRVSSEDVVEEEVYWLSALLQLKRILQAKPFQPIVPLVVLVPSQGDEAIEKDVEGGLMLPDLISANLISGYNIVVIPDSVNGLQGTSKLSEAVQWLVAQCPSSDKVHCQTLMQYVEDGVDREFSKHFYQDMKERSLAGLPSQDPSAIIELYNSVIQFLAEVASSEDLCELSWPVPEFAEPGGSKVLPHLQWNTPSHLGWLKKALLSFQIPHMDLPPLGAPWRPVCAMIFQYLSQTTSSLQTQEILQSQVENLLSRTYFKWKSRKYASSEDNGPSVEEIPWDSILALCINHKLRDWKPPQKPIAPEAVSKDGQTYVYFSEEQLRKFTRPVLWEEARLKTQKEVQQSEGWSKIKTQSFAKLYSHPLSPMEYCASHQTVNNKELSISSGGDLTQAISEADHLPEYLSAKLQQEKTESRRFEEQLQQLLVKDSETFQDFPSLPLYLPETLVAVPHIIHPQAKTPVLRSPEHLKDQLKLRATDTSVSQRFAYLKQLIRANKEEEMTCELHLSTLLDMIDA
uniref:Germinal-center associated nuclear protein n=1 Tax=Podarcis muralis TaxID=64176 RepID=A0A670HVG0_PODMU